MGESGRPTGSIKKTAVLPCSPSWFGGFLEREGTNDVDDSWPFSKKPSNAGLNHQANTGRAANAQKSWPPAAAHIS